MKERVEGERVLNISKNMDKKQCMWTLTFVNQILGVEAEKFTSAWDHPET